MAATRLPGPICQVLSWLDIDAGTLCRDSSPTPGPVQSDQPTADKLDGGVQGKIDGLGKDIVDFLGEVGEYFSVHIKVTSGLRDADAQANAMYDNWIKLERGKVYAAAALPARNREAMDKYYKIAEETDSATEKQKSDAKDKFLELGRLVKSRHSGGRAADIWLASISKAAHRAILMRMNEVKEGTRTDIIHVESTSIIPAVNDALRTKWRALLGGRHSDAVKGGAHQDGAACDCH
ncbi:MAG TPA: hypothetical protein VHM90_15320 [Phycisphaerae bacterium]|jgi:hypothetical protein|nr:hypothetical protein [Phycisphaerae bacterium]